MEIFCVTQPGLESLLAEEMVEAGFVGVLALPGGVRAGWRAG